MSSDGIWHIRDKLWPMPKHSSIRMVYACLAVTCHLHFWQNDRDFLRATVVTRGWNGYRNKSQHRKSTLEKKILPPFQQGFEPATFQSRVRRSNHWAIPAPFVCITALLYIVLLSLSPRPHITVLVGWAIKHQVTSLLFPVAIFHSVLVWCHSVLFCLGRCRCHPLVSFFSLACSLAFVSLGVQFLAICRAVLIYLVFFFSFFFSKAFLFWVILLISAIQRANFLNFLRGFREFSSTALFFFLILFFLAHRRAALCSQNACY